ncbi:hypothetical protein Q604_UNBc4C00214G0001, partial [human gut metagenome]
MDQQGTRKQENLKQLVVTKQQALRMLIYDTIRIIYNTIEWKFNLKFNLRRSYI